MIILSLSFKLTESHSSTADVLPKHSNTSHSTNHYQGSAILSDKQRADRLRQAIRLCGSSIRTEKTYLPFLPPNAQGTTAPHNQALDARLIRSQEVSESPSAMDTPAALSTAPTSSPPTGTMRGAHPRPPVRQRPAPTYPEPRRYPSPHHLLGLPSPTATASPAFPTRNASFHVGGREAAPLHLAQMHRFHTSSLRPHVHTLRAVFAHRRNDAGYRLDDLHQRMGHTDIRTTHRSLNGRPPAARNDPVAWQQHDATGGVRPVNDLAPDAVSVGRRWFPRIALGDERYVARLARDDRERFRPRGDAATGAGIACISDVHTRLYAGLFVASVCAKRTKNWSDSGLRSESGFAARSTGTPSRIFLIGTSNFFPLSVTGTASIWNTSSGT
ncbi:MAG: hypothetical protein KatS3mg109_1915 [Pirellulaceae bacterium]|nr:MAG: hypothetical protein KatS3mg055_1911 [Chloroflexus sp.]GIW91483.1 MAG: hypothetical protein KatS3mg109_1915 [Pirellulaceae bacterium]